MNYSSIVRTYGDKRYIIYCDLQYDIRAQKIKKMLPGYIYPLSHKIWSYMIKNFNWELLMDVGANYGEFTCDAFVYSTTYRPKIISIEPGKKIFGYLKKTCEEISNTIKTENVCITDTQGEVTFRENLKSSGGSRIWNRNLPFRDDQSIFKVKSRKLDSYLIRYNSVLVKIDTEGNEINILSSLSDQSLSEKNICFFVEINQLDFTEFIASHSSLNIFVYSKIRGKFVKNPSFFIYKKFLRKFYYLQDGLVTNSAEIEEIIKKFKINIFELFKWRVLNIKFKS